MDYPVQQLWKNEENETTTLNKNYSSDDKFAFLVFGNTTRLVNQRYKVGFPWKPNSTFFIQRPNQTQVSATTTVLFWINCNYCRKDRQKTPHLQKFYKKTLVTDLENRTRSQQFLPRKYLLNCGTCLTTKLYNLTSRDRKGVFQTLHPSSKANL